MKETDRTKKFKDRRKGPDHWSDLINWIAVTCWILMLIALIILGLSKPAAETFFDRFAKLEIPKEGNGQMLVLLLYVMVFGFLTSGVGMFINSRRQKRRDDRFKKSLIIINILSLVGIAIYLIR